MKRILVVLLALGMLTGCTSSPKGKHTIGVIQLADHPSLDATYEGMKEVLDEQLGKDNYVLDYKNAQGDIANTDMITTKFANDKVDVIYAIATNAAQSAHQATKGKDIPVVFNAVTDPIAAGLVDSLEKPGGNVTGVSDLSPAVKQLSVVKEILPDAKKVGVVYSIGEVNSSVQVEGLKAIADEVGVEIVAKGVSSVQDIPLAAQQLATEVDAFYNITDNMVVAAVASLIDVANKAGLPVFAAEDGQFDEGLLATESLSYKALGREAGAMIVDILVNGKKPADMPVVMSEETVLYASEAVAAKVNITLPESITKRMIERSSN